MKYRRASVFLDLVQSFSTGVATLDGPPIERIGSVKAGNEASVRGIRLSRCDKVEKEFANLRGYFLNRGSESFDLQEVVEDIRKHARRGDTITYGDLMRRFQISRGRTHGIAEVLWRISEREACLFGPSHVPPHSISAVVVRASTGYPSGGFFGLAGIPSDLERAEQSYADPLLSAQEKRYVEKVWNHLHHCRERDSNDGEHMARSDGGQI